MLILCNPHNPVGRAWTKEELWELSRICLENRVLMVSDEIHGDLILKGFTHTPLASLSTEVAENTITLAAPSKTFNIAGLSTAVAIVSEIGLRKRMKDMLDALHIC